MLEIIYDNRSGSKLEIIVPTFNEEKRIGNILNYYVKTFDVVILDNGSSDKTVSISKEAGATIFEWKRGPVIEEVLAYYINNLTKSGYCFALCADEFVLKENLLKAYNYLQYDNYIIMANRIDWAHGYCAKSITCIVPRGFRRGDARYDSRNLHTGLKYVEKTHQKYFEVDVHHLQLIDTKNDYGKVGKYIGIEIEQILKSSHPILRIIKRFIFSEIKSLLLKMWRFRESKPIFFIWLIADSMTVFLIAMMILIEKKLFISTKEQAKKYKALFDGPDDEV